MAGKRFLTLFLVASFVASLALVGAPLGASMAWATGDEKQATQPMTQPKHMEKKAALGTPLTTTY